MSEQNIAEDQIVKLKEGNVLETTFNEFVENEDKSVPQGARAWSTDTSLCNIYATLPRLTYSSS